MYLLLALLPLCPSSPNCVSSEAKDPTHYVAPIYYHGEGKNALIKLKSVALSQPRTTLIKESEETLEFEVRSKWIGFIDKIVCVLDQKQSVIQIASFSQIGYYDFGVNRARVEKWRLLFNLGIV